MSLRRCNLRILSVAALRDEKFDSLSVYSVFADHFGVVKAFLDADLLPRVISGTSAGGLVAALVCTRTDEELKTLLVPELANRISACEEPFKVWTTPSPPFCSNPEVSARPVSRSVVGELCQIDSCELMTRFRCRCKIV